MLRERKREKNTVEGRGRKIDAVSPLASRKGKRGFRLMMGVSDLAVADEWWARQAQM